MKLAVIGADGRAHALTWKLFNSPHVSTLDCLPGNGGTAPLSPRRDPFAPDASDGVSAMIGWAFREQVDLVVDAAGQLLTGGLADELAPLTVGALGPTRATALLLGSRCRTKDLLLRHTIPTAPGQAFTDAETAEKALATYALPVRIRANAPDGGEEVYTERLAAIEGVRALFAAHTSSDLVPGVVIEQVLTGPRISITALTDGTACVPFLPVHHADGVEPVWATGVSRYATLLRSFLLQNVLQPVMAALTAEGLEVRGVLGADCIITSQGPRVTALRGQFAPGEAEVVLPRLQDDLVPLIAATLAGNLASAPAPTFHEQATVGIGLVGAGYPHHYAMGGPIGGLDMLDAGVLAFHNATEPPLPANAPARRSWFGRNDTAADPLPRVAGGHVLTLVAQADSVATAWERAQRNATLVQFEGRTYREDYNDPAIR